jgi:hypothetical protein
MLEVGAPGLPLMLAADTLPSGPITPLNKSASYWPFSSSCSLCFRIPATGVMDTNPRASCPSKWPNSVLTSVSRIMTLAGKANMPMPIGPKQLRGHLKLSRPPTPGKPVSTISPWTQVSASWFPFKDDLLTRCQKSLWSEMPRPQ